MSAPSLRITHLVENLERGGLERVVIDLALEQASLGHRVQVICLFEPGVLAATIAGSEIAVTACHKRVGLDIRAIGTIRRLLKTQATQVLHTHNPIPHYHGVLASTLLPGITVVNTRHGMGNAPFNRRREFLYRLSLSRTSAVAMVCESARRNFVQNGIVSERKARVVPNGIRLARFSAASEQARSAALALLRLDREAFVVGIVSRLNRVKDHATLLHAMVAVRAEITNALLVVVGGGPLHAELSELVRRLDIADAVLFVGDRDDVDALLPAFDLFVLSSLTEGYSIALLEACACSLPIVATRVGGNAEIVQSGVNGLLVDPGNPDALATAIVALAEDDELRSAMGAAGRAWVAIHGTIESMGRRYMGLYRPGHA